MKSELLSNAIEAHEAALPRLDKLVEGLTDEQANWKPAPKKWSIAECLQHLNQGIGEYNDRIAPALKKAKADGKSGEEPYGRGTFIGRYIVNFLKKPSKRAPAPGVFKPASSGLKIGEVAETFRSNVRRFNELAAEADGLKLGHVVIKTPVSSLIRVSLAQAFELHTLHTPRHLGQAEKVKEKEGYPA